MDTFLKNKEKFIKIFNILLLITIIFLATKYAGKFFAPFILGYILSIVLYPIFKLLHIKYKINKNISGILCIIFLLSILSSIGVSIASQLIEEIKDFSKNIPYYLDNIKHLLEDMELKIINLIAMLPDGIEKILLKSYANTRYFFGEFLGSGLRQSSVKIIKKIPNGFMIAILGIISCYFFMIDKKNIEHFILRQFPKKYLPKFKTIKTGINKSILGYIKAQLIIMCLVSTICFIGLSIIKAPYSLLVAIIIGIIDAFPIFGSGFILWPLAIYNLVIKDYTLSIGLILIYIVIVIFRQSVEPKILGEQIGVHPLVTLMSIYIGIKLFGFLGFILGPMIMVIIKCLQNDNVLPKWR